MKLSRTIAYAVKATLALSKAETGTTVNCKELADVGGMPDRFLLQILRSLVTHGILRSTRGAKGGFALSREPEQISLLDIIEAVDGPVSFDLPGAEDANPRLQEELRNVSGRVRQELDALKLSSLLPHPEAEGQRAEEIRPQQQPAAATTGDGAPRDESSADRRNEPQRRREHEMQQAYT